MKTSIQEGIMRRNLMPDDLMGAYVLAFAFGLVPEDLCDAYKEKFLSLLEKSELPLSLEKAQTGKT